MKLNNIYCLLIGVLLLAITAPGCTKELEQSAVSTATKPAVFGSEDGLKLYSLSFYDMLPSISTPYKTDVDLSDYGAISSAPDYVREGAYSSRQSSGWDWDKLRNVNYFIVNCTNPSVPEDVRNNYLGLARFFRAYFYFDKMVRFGDVPWYGKPLNIGDTALLYKGRDPRVLIMDSIVADLDFAAANIKAWDDPTRSTITKSVVFGFKSRVCLFEGTFRKYQTSFKLTGSADKYLQLAADAADSVMASGKYGLNTAGDQPYRNLFISEAPVATEVMLADVSSVSLAKFNDANWYFTSATYGRRFSFTRTFINTFLNIDGTPFTDKVGHETMVFADEVKNRDLRLQQTIRMGGYQRITGGNKIPAPPTFSYTYTGYMPIKWSLDDMYYDGGTLNTNSVPLMRYAEILLNYAEAKAELGKLTNQDWIKTIGALRGRAGITGGLDQLPVKVDPYMQKNYFPDISDPVIMEIRRERGIELTLEGFRMDDLIRWKHGELLTKPWNGFYVPALNKPMDLNGDGIMDVCFYTTMPSDKITGVTYVNVSKEPQTLEHGTYGELEWLSNIPRVWKSYQYLYPIPYEDIQVNSNLKQNPGWEEQPAP
ncbi:MAG TPA: RagB/SusD family nutrient uptake outer membrane protein [Arachidicoccus sp.]|nr:RagB/SusD family nutrient uptake outer membrane protein [Arachidicoccus sp.]